MDESRLEDLTFRTGPPAIDVGYIAWGAGAAASPVLFRMYGVSNVLSGLMSSAIAVTAFRRGERWTWWALLVGNTVALLSAMTHDKTVNAIGPFELLEYVGLALIWGALAITVPCRSARRPVRATA